MHTKNIPPSGRIPCGTQTRSSRSRFGVSRLLSRRSGKIHRGVKRSHVHCGRCVEHRRDRLRHKMDHHAPSDSEHEERDGRASGEGHDFSQYRIEQTDPDARTCRSRTWYIPHANSPQRSACLEYSPISTSHTLPEVWDTYLRPCRSRTPPPHASSRPRVARTPTRPSAQDAPLSASRSLLDRAELDLLLRGRLLAAWG